MIELLRTYDPKTGRDLLRPYDDSPRIVSAPAMSARAALQAVKARRREVNRRQNFVRWSVNRTDISGTWNPTQLYPVLFDTEHYSNPEYKGRKVHCVPTTSWRFQCGEPGIHNVKGHFTLMMSFPAVPVIRAQRAVLTLRHRSFKLNSLTYYEQSQQFGTIGITGGGATIMNFLYGFSLPIRDKIVLEAGDELEAFWYFQGAAAMSFIEEYTGFIAIQRTGEAYIDGDCCE